MALKTRLLKAECFDCGYVVRVTRTHVARIGTPLCPCNGAPMDSLEFQDWANAEAALDAAAAGGFRPIRSRWIERVAVVHGCSHCRGDIEIGEPAHLDVYTVDGEFFNDYTCFRCHGSTRSQFEPQVAA